MSKLNPNASSFVPYVVAATEEHVAHHDAHDYLDGYVWPDDPPSLPYSELSQASSELTRLAYTAGDVVPKAAGTVVAAQPAGDAAFVPSTSFDGARPGYLFRTGDQGLGYYRDKPFASRRRASPVDP